MLLFFTASRLALNTNLIFEIGSNVPYVLIDTDLSNLQQITVSTKNLFNTILF
jgi:hypothetical protein